MAFCPQCGKSVGADDTFCPSCGFDLAKNRAAMAKQNPATPIPPSPAPQPGVQEPQTPKKPRGNPVKPLIKAEDRVLRMVPVFAALDYWLVIGGLLLIYCGVSELVLHYGPGTAFAISAVPAGALYIYLARTYHVEAGEGWILQAVVALSVLVIAGDFIVTGVFTTLSALLVMVNLVVLFTALHEHQGKSQPAGQ